MAFTWPAEFPKDENGLIDLNAHIDLASTDKARLDRILNKLSETPEGQEKRRLIHQYVRERDSATKENFEKQIFSFDWPVGFPMTRNGNPDLEAFFHSLSKDRQTKLLNEINVTLEGREKIKIIREYAVASNENDEQGAKIALRKLYGLDDLIERRDAINHQLDHLRNQERELKENFKRDVLTRKPQETPQKRGCCLQ